MVSFLAVVFFCAGNECYFWSSSKLQPSETACQRELAVVVKELEAMKAKPFFQCLKVPLVGA